MFSPSITPRSPPCLQKELFISVCLKVELSRHDKSQNSLKLVLQASGGAIINQYLRVLPFSCLLRLLLVSLVICLIFHAEQVQTEAYTAMCKALLSVSEKVLVVYLLSQYIYLQGA